MMSNGREFMTVSYTHLDLFAAGEVVFIMAIGALLEEATTNRAKKGLKKLISLAPVSYTHLL